MVNLGGFALTIIIGGSRGMSPATLYTSWMLSGRKQMGFEIYQCYM